MILTADWDRAVGKITSAHDALGHEKVAYLLNF